MVNIKWNKKALAAFQFIFRFISEDSITNAENVRNDIFMMVDTLMKNPEKHNLDKFKVNNDGHFRAFEKHKIRVTYFISKNEIRIVRVRHTKMNPKNF
jgi:plasmid stabilization system protein ParE